MIFEKPNTWYLHAYTISLEGAGKLMKVFEKEERENADIGMQEICSGSGEKEVSCVGGMADRFW